MGIKTLNIIKVSGIQILLFTSTWPKKMFSWVGKKTLNERTIRCWLAEHSLYNRARYIEGG